MTTHIAEKLEALNPDQEIQKQTHVHIINPPNNMHIWEPGMSSADVVRIAREKQLPVHTLCGITFVPSQDPGDLPSCETCMDVAHRLMRESFE